MVFDDDRDVAPVGVVPLHERGAAPFWLLHDESLVAITSWALEAAGVDLLDHNVPMAYVQERACPLVLHDPLCPLTPVSFIADAVALSAATQAVVVGVREVTDTVKRIEDGQVGETLDRSELLCVTSPIVLPPAVLVTVGTLQVGDFAALVEKLAAHYPVQFLPAPSIGRRLATAADIAILEALAAVEARAGESPNH